MPKLPDKPSELIRLALTDLAKAERSAKYNVNMSTWHDPAIPYGNDKCEVCLAGSVMAFSLNADINNVVMPGDFPTKTRQKLKALNYLRIGGVGFGLQLMQQLNKAKRAGFDFTDRDHFAYEADPRGFKRDMRKLANDLAKAGL